MLDTLISSKTRIKLLQKFFLNANTRSYLRGLEAEFGESTNAIRLELNRLEKAGMISAQMDGNKKVFRANNNHPLFIDLQNLVRKYMGIDHIIDQVVNKLGDLQKVYLIGDYAKGLDKGIIDLVLIGKDIDHVYLINLLNKTESLIKRKLRHLHFCDELEAKSILEQDDSLLIWSSDVE